MLLVLEKLWNQAIFGFWPFLYYWPFCFYISICLYLRLNYALSTPLQLIKHLQAFLASYFFIFQVGFWLYFWVFYCHLGVLDAWVVPSINNTIGLRDIGINNHCVYCFKWKVHLHLLHFWTFLFFWHPVKTLTYETRIILSDFYWVEPLTIFFYINVWFLLLGHWIQVCVAAMVFGRLQFIWIYTILLVSVYVVKRRFLWGILGVFSSLPAIFNRYKILTVELGWAHFVDVIVHAFSLDLLKVRGAVHACKVVVAGREFIVNRNYGWFPRLFVWLPERTRKPIPRCPHQLVCGLWEFVAQVVKSRITLALASASDQDLSLVCADLMGAFSPFNGYSTVFCISTIFH